MINGAQDTEEFGNDATYMENKTKVGLDFADSSFNDVEKAKDIMKNITDDIATVTNAKNIMSAILQDDQVNNKYTTGIVTVGSSVDGEIEVISDEDWFKPKFKSEVQFLT